MITDPTHAFLIGIAVGVVATLTIVAVWRLLS